jgi:hypothetical protein
MTPSIKDLFRSNRFEKRYEIINYFIKSRDFKRYLEVGTSSGKCIARIKCAGKEGVDPMPRGQGDDWKLHKMTSDDFFASNQDKYNLIFVDGLHTSDQVIKDIFNSLRCLEPKGVILVHDCNPLTEAAQRKDPGEAGQKAWNGDVWKAVAYIRKHVPRVFCHVIARDQGIGLVVPRDYNDIPDFKTELEAQAMPYMESLSWEDLVKDRNGTLGLINSREEMEELLSGLGVGI